MIEINKRNALCQILNLDRVTMRKLYELLQYNDPNVEFAINQKSKRINEINDMLTDSRFKIMDKTGLYKERAKIMHIIKGLEQNLTKKLFDGENFPTGLLPRVLELLNNSKLEYGINDLRKKPEFKKIKYVLKNPLPQLRYYQKEAANNLTKDYRGIAEMVTGSGKTVLIAKMLWDLGLPSVIITPNKNITDMMLDTLRFYFGKSKVDKLTTKTSQLKKPINIVNMQAMIKIDPEVFSDIDAVFTDEFHHSSAETLQQINVNHLKNAYVRVGMTATNFRNDGSDIALEAVLSSVLYEYPATKAFEDGFLVEPEFRLIENKGISGRSYQDEYKKGIVQNLERNNTISELAHEHKDDNIIILVQHVEHGENLKALIPHAKFIHGQTKDKDRQKLMENFRKGKLKCLIGTSVLGEGIDLPIAKILIMAGGGKAKSQIMQNIGRVLRLFPNKDKAIIYDFTDDGTNWLNSHSTLREEIYNEY